MAPGIRRTENLLLVDKSTATGGCKRASIIVTSPADIDHFIQVLSNRLTTGATATGTLLAWCEEHRLSQGPIAVKCHERLRLQFVPGEVKMAAKLNAGETIHYRRVQLIRGPVPLASAENWFVPQRLTAGMNNVLNHTDVPFGTAVAPLTPSRRTVAANARLSTTCAPAPTWLKGSDSQQIILEHVAVVLSGDETVLAVVKERYFSSLIPCLSPIGF